MPTNVEPQVRFRSASIVASERPKRIYTYYVTGRGPFPIDMLRYDSAWPAGSEDALRFYEERDRRSICLMSYQEPTVARWNSFSWSVGTEKLY